MEIKLLEIREAGPITIDKPKKIYEIMSAEAKADRECFWVLHLNARLQVIEKELVAMGVLSSCPVHPREVFKKAIIYSARGIITVHNHPSGDLSPSNGDHQVWKQLDDAGKILGIEVLDHIIISAKGYLSFKETFSGGQNDNRNFK